MILLLNFIILPSVKYHLCYYCFYCYYTTATTTATATTSSSTSTPPSVAPPLSLLSLLLLLQLILILLHINLCVNSKALSAIIIVGKYFFLRGNVCWGIYHNFHESNIYLNYTILCNIFISFIISFTTFFLKKYRLQVIFISKMLEAYTIISVLYAFHTRTNESVSHYTIQIQIYYTLV